MTMQTFRRLSSLCVMLLSYFAAFSAHAQTPIPIYDANAHKLNIKPMTTHGLAHPSDMPASGSSCSTITFEGLGNLQSIPSFYGVSLPDWLSIIEKGAGGSGNFSGEPSPITIAFWLYGEPTFQTIQVPNGASSFSMYYASYYPITLTGLDANGNTIATATAPANYDTATNYYDIWSPISISAPSGQTITALNVAGYANYTGIDDLNVCQSPSIASVEVTQAVQQFQTLADLKISLASNGQPPVPIIAGKPAVLRTYFNPLQSVTNFSVKLSGVTNSTKSLTITPNCAPADQRSGANQCQSMDFYFTPPPGSWTATLDVLDSSGKTLEEENLTFKSVTTDSMRVRGVSVCDSMDANAQWQCGTASDLLANTGLLAKIAPTALVVTDVTTSEVKRDVNDTTTYPNKLAWWYSTAGGLDDLFGLFDRAGDLLTGRRTTYFGMIRPLSNQNSLQFAGLAYGTQPGVVTPSHGALSLSQEAWGSYNLVPTTVAHEVGHTLGGKHTNTNVPPSSAVPGCWDLASDSTTYWPYGDNYVQSGPASSPNLEVPFDVAAQKPFPQKSEFEIMSYCAPGWISPQSYTLMMNTLIENPGSSMQKTSNGARPADAASTTGQFWQVSGSISGSTVIFRPLFQYMVQGDTTTGSGTYSLQVQDSGGTTLFTRQFTPDTPVLETGPGMPGTSPSGNFATFSQVIPVMTGVAAIVLYDSTNTELGRITFSGKAPVVTITSPAAGSVASGTQMVAWTVSGAAAFWSKVLYSPDNGGTWSVISDLQNRSTGQVNFDLLPGSSKALIQVLVSDGVNTGSATSPLFTVSRKKPSVVQITNPLNNAALPAVNSVYLSGSAYDVDDGVLTGSALQWSDSAAGNLGTGSPLIVTLKPGAHAITLTGTDSDGNSVSSTVNVTMGGDPPVVSLSVKDLNSAPVTCAYATVNATPGVNAGAGLSSVQYSVDGGTSYKDIPLGNLPFGFLVPGSGFIHLVARASDISGQSNAQDTTFFTQSACTLKTQTITFAALNDVVFGVAPINLQATSDSGLPVTFSVSGPATLSGSTLTITGVGMVTVTAMQAGNSTYAPANLVSHSFNVLQATPAITWAATAPIPYGTTLAKVLTASAAVGSSSIPGAYSYTAQASGSATVAVTFASVLSAGTYTLTVTFTPTDNVDYATVTASVSLVVSKGTASVSLTSSANPSVYQATVKLTATVSDSTGQATGTVTFYDGSASLGSAAVASGQAVLSLPSLSGGQHSLTAVYSGDQNFNQTTSAALTQVVADFTMTSDSSSRTVQANGSTTLVLHVAPSAGNTIPIAVSFSISGLPSGSGASASFTPSSIAANSGATDVTLVIQAGSSHAALLPLNRVGAKGMTISFAFLLLPFSFRRKLWKHLRNRSLLSVVFILSAGVALLSLAGCGDNSQPKTYNVTVAATAGTLTHSVPLTVTIY